MWGHSHEVVGRADRDEWQEVGVTVQEVREH